MLPENVIKSTSSQARAQVYVILICIAVLGLAVLVGGIISPVLYLGLLFSLFFVGLFLTNLKYFIIVFIALRTIMEAFLEPTRIPLGGSSIQLVGFMGVMILAGGMAYILINRIKILEVWVALPFTIFLLVSLPWMIIFSGDKVTGVKDWIGTASALVLFILVASTFKSRKDIKLLLGAMVFSTIPPLIVAYYQLVTGTGNLATEGFNRIYGTFIHPNSLGAYLGMMLLLCIPLMLESKKLWHKVGFGFLNLAMLFALISTYARSAWLGFAFGVVILAVFRYRKLLLLGPIAVVGLLVLVPSILGRFQEALGFSQGQGSLFFRMEMTKFLLTKFYESPVMGNGLGSFAIFDEEGLGYFFLPHNDYVRVLVDTGLVGMVSYLGVWFGLIRGSLRTYYSQVDDWVKVMAVVMLAIVCDYLLSSTTENLFRMVIEQTYIWTMAGMVAASARSTVAEETETQRLPDQLRLADVRA